MSFMLTIADLAVVLADFINRDNAVVVEQSYGLGFLVLEKPAREVVGVCEHFRT